jgi:hypothetical protein
MGIDKKITNQLSNMNKMQNLSKNSLKLSQLRRKYYPNI